MEDALRFDFPELRKALIRALGGHRASEELREKVMRLLAILRLEGSQSPDDE